MKISSWIIFLLSLLLFAGCGSNSEDSGVSLPSSQWVSVTDSVNNGDSVSLKGAAWVSGSWSGSNCIGFACFYDMHTDDSPGVTISWTNRTTGSTGNASSQYGPGTNWLHIWSATVPLSPVRNTIDISAFDPSGKGGTITIHVDRTEGL